MKVPKKRKQLLLFAGEPILAPLPAYDPVKRLTLPRESSPTKEIDRMKAEGKKIVAWEPNVGRPMGWTVEYIDPCDLKEA